MTRYNFIIVIFVCIMVMQVCILHNWCLVAVVSHHLACSQATQIISLLMVLVGTIMK